MINRNFSFFLGLAVACIFTPDLVEAQAGSYENYDGGTNIWEASATSGSPTAGFSVGDWNSGNYWVNYSNANFTGASGVVTVDNYNDLGGLFPPVIVGQIYFNSNSTGTIEFTGDPITEYNDQATLINVDPNNKTNVVFDQQINVDLPAGNESTYIFNSSTNSTLTLGAINFTTSTDPSIPTMSRNDQNLSVHGANGTTTIFNGVISADANLQSSGVFGDYGTNSTAIYEINGGLSYVPRGGTTGKDFDFASGEILLGTSNLGTGSLTYVGNGNGDNGASIMPILTSVGGLTITNVINAQYQSNAEVGGNSTGTTTFNGAIYAGSGGGRLRLNAVAGGTSIFNGDIGGNNSYTLSSGAGTVVLNNATGNDFTSYTPVAFEVGSGTTVLIKNTSNSAFGNTTSSTAQIDAGGTLGGSGISSEQVVAAAHSSVIAPGNGTSTVTLHLLGGLTTTGVSGLTMKFDLNGAAHDMLDLGSAAMVLNGPIDISFINLGTVVPGIVYTLASGTGAWSGTPLFNVTAPAGDILNPLYGVGGVMYDTTAGADSLSVEFVAAPIPEPSPVILLSVSIAGLAFIRWIRRGSALSV